MHRWRSGPTWLGAALVATLLASGCSTVAGEPTATSASKTPSRLDTLPECSTIHPEYFKPDPDPALDCVLRSTDSAKLVFEVLGTPPETVKVFGPDGALRQTISQPVNMPQRNTPFLGDLDRDGRDELLIVTSAGGNGGQTMAVWRADQQSGQFSSTGEIFGFPDFRITDEGFTAFYSHTGAGSGILSLVRFVDNKLTAIATLEVQTLDWEDPAPVPNWTINGGTKCALVTSDDPAKRAAQDKVLTDAGVDPATAQEHFCSQEWVGKIYRKH